MGTLTTTKITTTKNADQKAIGVEDTWNTPPSATRPNGAAASHESDAIRSWVRGKLSRCPHPIGSGRPLSWNLHKPGGVQSRAKV